MDGEYETPQPDLALYHDYIEPVYEYDNVGVTSPSRDSQYEQVPPGGRPTVALTSSHEYTHLSSLTTATSTAPPAYQPGEFSTCQPAVMTMTSLQQQQPAVTVTVMNQVPVRPAPVAEGFLHRQSVALGVLLIIVALLSATFNTVDLVVTVETLQPRGYYNSAAVVCHGLWGGLLCFVTGALAVAAGRTKNRCTIIAFMTLSIISSVACFIQLTVAAVAAGIIDSDVRRCQQFGRLTRTSYYSPSSTGDATDICNKVRSVYVMEILLAVLGGLAAVACIYGAAICCRSACSCCCCADPQARQQRYVATENGLPLTVLDQRGQLMPLSYVVTSHQQQQQQQQQPIATAPPYNMVTGHSQSQLPKY